MTLCDRLLALGVIGLLTLPIFQDARAQVISDVFNTKHNLSISGPGPVRATTESEICVFCHTPHGATQIAAPLWNRQLSPENAYTVYTSSSLDAETIKGALLDQPGGSSKLCLSCHDGTLAIGTVNVKGGSTNVTIQMGGTAGDGSMPAGAGEQTGFTRDLGTDLRNDHPISLDYTSQLAITDTELRDPALESHIGIRVPRTPGTPAVRPPLPLEPTGAGNVEQLQCGTCHDPHIRDTDVTKVIKFLRLNRFQEAAPAADGSYDQATDIVCIACHRKEGWGISVHASATVAIETYNNQQEYERREFPANLPVWQAACLNCHDTHTVTGARRLLREGTDSIGIPKSGGGSAIEETCYQCHSNTSIVSGNLKDIRGDFGLAIHMPITNTEQAAATEAHDITDVDLAEPQLALGKGNLDNRHAECTDCHNPHRVMKNTRFDGTGANNSAIHVPPTNDASGALRGAFGVEPITYEGAAFLSRPTNFDERRGLGGSQVSKEYQVCLKCHSNYGYDDAGTYPTGGRPSLGGPGGTALGTNDLTQYTNQAMEFQAPVFHKGETTTTDSGAGAGFSTNNHRSWHPVMDDTGRDLATRGGMSSGAFLAPWATTVGGQTMYCTDCHGSDTPTGQITPPGNNAWGPHGSTNDFLLKGTWTDRTGNNSDRVGGPTDPNNGLCFKCHDWETYADRNSAGNVSGFSCDDAVEPSGCDDRGPFENGHGIHADRVGSIRCTWCHVAVPHGWKNKALLVNLNDVGLEAGPVALGEVDITSSGQVFTQGPYYLNAKLKVVQFAPSGQWQPTNCGSASVPAQGGTGTEWMGNVCSDPP